MPWRRALLPPAAGGVPAAAAHLVAAAANSRLPAPPPRLLAAVSPRVCVGEGRRPRPPYGALGQRLADLLAELAPTNHEATGVPENAATGKEGARFPLARVDRLLKRLGNPQHKMYAVHVVGSKGKGSCASLVAHMLASSGKLPIGLYTSPHVLHLSERVRVIQGGADATRDDDAGDTELFDTFMHFAPKIRAAQREANGALTRFEVLTCLALAHFANADVRVAVIEAGLGGVSDATNVFGGGRGREKPPVFKGAGVSGNRVLGVLCTHVSNEHASALGGTLASVCEAKAGIAARGRPFVIARQTEPGTSEMLVSAAEKAGARVSIAGKLVRIPGRRKRYYEYVVPGNRQPFSPRSSHQVRIKIDAPAVTANVAAAIALVMAIRARPDTPKKVSMELWDNAIQSVKDWIPPRGRGERLERKPGWPSVVVDGAHTPASIAEAIAAAQPTAAVVSLMSDKDAAGVITVLRDASPTLRRVVFVQSSVDGNTTRFHDADTLRSMYYDAGTTDGDASATACTGRIADAMHQAAKDLEMTRAGGTLLVTGSFYAVAEAMRFWHGMGGL